MVHRFPIDLFVSAQSVGKSCLLNRLVKDSFLRDAETTVGINYVMHTIEKDGIEMQIQYCDTAGKEDFRADPAVFLPAAKGVMLVYDVTNKASFDSLTHWVKDVKAHAHPDVPIMVVGNKLDARHVREVEDYDAEKFCHMHDLAKGVKVELQPGRVAEHEVLMWKEVSASSGEFVPEAFDMLVEAAYSAFFKSGVLWSRAHAASRMAEMDGELVSPQSRKKKRQTRLKDKASRDACIVS